jgi:hypothetical protein
MEAHVRDWSIPGEIDSIPLLLPGPEKGEMANLFLNYGFLHVTRIPDGLEALTLSKLSAALSPLIANHQAFVEFNMYLRLAGNQGLPLTLSPYVIDLTSRFRQCWSQRHKMFNAADYDKYTVGVLDSGLDIRTLRTEQTHKGIRTRRIIAFDYLKTRLKTNTSTDQIFDSKQHGAIVCQILDALLPIDVSLAVGRVRDQITVLYLAQCFADLVAKSNPIVVNLSLGTRISMHKCPRCNRKFSVSGFHSIILPRVFKLAGRTFTVQAAGNDGRLCNPKHILADVEKHLYAVAYGSNNELANYSNFVDDPHLLGRTIGAFGGDSPYYEGGYSVVANKKEQGTSFAAPFVSAAVSSAYIKHGEEGNVQEIVSSAKRFISFL